MDAITSLQIELSYENLRMTTGRRAKVLIFKPNAPSTTEL